jgi:hypothetical protein
VSNQADDRRVIPPGKQPRAYRHLFPIAQLLIERGHNPIDCPDKFGFCPTQGGMVCTLTHRFTQEDWNAINERFVVPDNIRWFNGLIRDTANHIDMMGTDEIMSRGELIPIGVWEERRRQSGRL